MCRKRTPGITLMLLVGTLVAGSGGQARGQQPQLAGTQNPGQQIVALQFECAAPIDRDGLLRVLPFHEGGTVQEGDLELARQRLLQTELFTEVSIDAVPRAEGVTIVVHLVRKAIVNAVHFQGNDALSDDELRRTARVHEGVVLTDELRAAAVVRLRQRYGAEGFDTVRVMAVVRARTPGEVDVTFRIDAGPPLRVGAIEIEGGLPVSQDKIRKALDIEAGDRYVRAQQRKAQGAIVKLLRRDQYFEADVSSRWERGAANIGILRFTIDAGPRFAIRFSGNHHFGDKHLLGLMDLQTRAIVTDGTWRELARRAQRAYQEAGYYFARVDVHIEAGPPKVVRFDITEDERFRVAAVDFEGNHGLSAELLRGQMATRPPSWIPWRRGSFVDDVFNDDLKRLWFFYRQQGFETAKIVDVRTRFDREHGEVFVTVIIEEGRQTIVRDIAFDGTELIAQDLPKLQVEQNQPLNPDNVEADRRTLLAAFGRAGYTRAEVTPSVSTKPEANIEAATVRFRATPGDEERVGEIIVQDNFDTRTRVIERELPFKEGDPLNPDALLRGQSNIYRLGLFRSVTVRPLGAPVERTRRDIGVSVSEKPPGTLQWGVGYNTRDGFSGFIEVAHNNLQGLARRLSLRGALAIDPGAVTPDQYLADLGFREPHLGDTQWSLGSDLLAQRSTRAIDEFSIERVAFIPAIERALLPGWRTGVEVGIEKSHVFDVKPDVLAIFPDDEGHFVTNSIGPFTVYDGRDDAFVPHRGVFDSVRLKFAPSQLGTDVPFVKVIGQHSQYVPLQDLTFVYAVRAGWARAYEDGEQLNIRERFFLGGRTTVRGFSENSIGPHGDQGKGDPLGGDWALNLNAELRFPLVFGFGGVVFVDGGGVYLQDFQEYPVSIHDFRRSTGLGLRYITPIGPLSLEYGFKLDRRSGESLGQVHFSIGNIF